MVSGWYLFNKDRKISIRLTWFLIVVLLISILLGFLLKSNKAQPKNKPLELKIENGNN